MPSLGWRLAVPFAQIARRRGEPGIRASAPNRPPPPPNAHRPGDTGAETGVAESVLVHMFKSNGLILCNIFRI